MAKISTGTSTSAVCQLFFNVPSCFNVFTVIRATLPENKRRKVSMYDLFSTLFYLQFLSFFMYQRPSASDALRRGEFCRMDGLDSATGKLYLP